MDRILQQQQNELTEYFIYSKLAERISNEENKRTLLAIANQELEHHDFWKKITKQEVSPNQFTIKKHLLLAKIFGLSFSLRLLEANEAKAYQFYDEISKEYPEVLKIKTEESEHEQKLINILNDYRLVYAGAIVLGLSDALVEFTGTLSGLTFAFNNNLIVGSTGLVMGLAASLSMGASSYLSAKEDSNGGANPFISSIYTAVAYLATVILLVIPYLIQGNSYIALGSMLIITVVVIASYTYYISIAKNISFKKRFVEMAAISLGVAIVSFGIGLLVKHFFGIDV